MSHKNQEPPAHQAKVDQQDGGPGSHTEDGGDTNDVASGGVSSQAESGNTGSDSNADSGDQD